MNTFVMFAAAWLFEIFPEELNYGICRRVLLEILRPPVSSLLKAASQGCNVRRGGGRGGCVVMCQCLLKKRT